jgi:hypothetical protein
VAVWTVWEWLRLLAGLLGSATRTAVLFKTRAAAGTHAPFSSSSNPWLLGLVVWLLTVTERNVIGGLAPSNVTVTDCEARSTAN